MYLSYALITSYSFNHFLRPGGNLDSGPLPADGGTATDQHLPTSSDSSAACFKDASVQVTTRLSVCLFVPLLEHIIDV